MAYFASTTTSGYSDPLKAMSIKALEQRMKDQQAQAAAQPPEAALAATIPGGIGNVLGIVGDKMNAARNENAAAEGRNELAGVISQGPKGPDGNWAPEQLAVMARRSPELMEKFYQQQHETKQLATTEGGLNSRNTATIGGQNERSTNEIAGRAANVAATQAGETGRTIATLASKEKEGGLDRAASSEQLESKQEHDTRMARLNSELAQAQKERDNAFTSGQTGKAQEHETNITRLKSELASGEARQSERFQASQLNQRLAQDEKLAGLQRDAMAANLEKQLAAGSTDKERQIKADENLARVQSELAARRDTIKQEHEVKLQTQAESATAANIAAKNASEERIAGAKIAATAAENAADPKKAEAIVGIGTKYIQQVQASDKLEKALHILDNGGINTGPWARAETMAANLTNGKFGGTKEMAQRTTDFNSILNEHTIKQMSETLKGQSTDFEMTKFIETLNNPLASPERRREALTELIAASKTAQAMHADAVTKVGGNLDRINEGLGKKPVSPPAAAGGAPAAAAPAAAAGGGGRPAGASDEAILAEAQKSMAGATPEQQQAIQQRLKAWNVKGL